MGLLSAAGAGYFAYVTLEGYREILSRAGQLPPAAAHLLRGSPLLFALAPLVVFGVWRFWPRPADRGVAAMVAGAALFFVLPSLASTIMSSLVLR